MKTSVRCPKCEGRKIWVIEHYVVPDESKQRGGHAMWLVKGRGVPKPKRNKPPSIFDDFLPTIEPHGVVDLYLCGTCGYVEFWGRDFPDLVDDPLNGVRLLDATGERGPFR